MRDDASVDRQWLGGLVSALALSSAVAAWWVVGDLSEPDLFAPDYMFESPEISRGVENAFGVVGCLVTAGIWSRWFTPWRSRRSRADSSLRSFRW